MNKFTKAAIPTAIALALVGCNSLSNDDDDSIATMTMATQNLEPLGDSHDYEGWIITADGAISTGTFDMVDNGTDPVSFSTEPASFTVNREDLDNATAFVLSIEPEENDPAGPSETKILGGAITDGTANAVVNHPAAFSSDFTDAAGTFILATPTNADPATSQQGIWYLTPPDVASLTLPTLPTGELPDLTPGWKYEGWVVVDGIPGPISTGTFETASEEDSDKGGSSAGPLDAPDFPGQDFISPIGLNLVGATAVISVEPYPDNSPAPFVMKPLVSTIAATGNVLENNALATNPSATVSFK